MKTFLWINILWFIVSACAGHQENSAASPRKTLHIDLSYPFLGGMPPKGQNRVIKPAQNKKFEITYQDFSKEIVSCDAWGNTMVKDLPMLSLKTELKTKSLSNFETTVMQDYLSQDSTASLLTDDCLKEAYQKSDFIFSESQDSIRIEVNRYGYTFYCFHTKSIQLRP